jgi:nicotinamide-nucleotide amidase
MKGIVITIGDELLNGQIYDTNSAKIAEMLTAIGVEVIRFMSISDSESDIREAIDSSLNEVDHVLVTGGLGPTKDDITKPVVCDLFNISEHWVDEEVKEFNERIFKSRKELLELNKDNWMIPESATTLMNKKGTAPGLKFERNGSYLYLMPGVPAEMKYLMENEIIPDIVENGVDFNLLYRFVSTYQVPESELSALLEDFEAGLPNNISLSYLPNLDKVKLRLSGKGYYADEINTDLDKHYSDLLNHLSKYFYVEGDIEIEERLSELLINYDLKLGVAESCTGGYLSHLITSVPGCSQYYMGSLVSYSYEVKNELLNVNKEKMEREGAVSQDTVEQMAGEVKNIMNADCSMAISGIAGPGGATPDKPVGTVWICTRLKEGMETKKYQFKGSRDQIIIRSARAAMIQLIGQIQS